ncbi:Transposon Tf2-9 polyprotein [Stylophora pistillata]|uniref:Transposon Tf2-9 polyprotein n=1 Tax=Stylophora pistillata TaxID=50429 RepID=A0A2B4S229_STYPI|nr:Transposon Tf2-9 polyprotein [Stylophora pistillata]
MISGLISFQETFLTPDSDVERIKPPSELDIDSLNLADIWKEWKEAWELYRISSGLHEKVDAIQIATIQSILGTKARRVLKTLPNIPKDITQRTVGGILTAMETYCVPRKNTTYKRYVFRMTTQKDRSLNIFVTDLRRAEYCDFGAIKDSLIRDQIVVGIIDNKLRERLLREADLTLEKAMNLCRITEQSREQSKIFISPTTKTGNIDAVKKAEPPVDTAKSKHKDWRRLMKCKFCTTSHDRGKCPAYGAPCHKCNGRNHYAQCCFKSKNGREERSVRHVEIEEHESNELLEGLYIEEIQGNTRRNIQSNQLVNDIPLSFKLDTGAECNVISSGLATELNSQLQPTIILLKSFGRHQLDTVGKCPLDTKVKGAKGSTPLEFYVLRDNLRPLLGLESCLHLELITLNNKLEQIGISVNEVREKFTLLDEFQDVLQGLGCVEGEYNIKLKANSNPTIQPQRNVPLRLIDKLKGTLKDLEQKDIIAKVEEPITWVSNLVIVEKPNKTLRLCLDPPDLNEAIEKEDFKPPSFETISSALPIFDDIIIEGRDEQEHDMILRKMLTRVRERNIKFNRDKIQFRVNKVKYMGEVVSELGFSPDRQNLCYLQYAHSIMQARSVKSDVPWTWFPEHDTALTKLKSVLSSTPVLRFYDTSLPTTLQVDATESGLGACLMQQNQPVAYASRAMSSSEINYAQIEKELLAIVYGCERFNMYMYGAEIEVLSDHKPLESIFKKPLFKVPPRSQRMRLRLQRYNLKVRYVPGKFLYIADTLSRAIDQSSVPTDDDMHHDMEHFIHSVILEQRISDMKLMDLPQLNCNDPSMQLLHRYAMEGWPQHKRDVPPSLKSFWNVRNDIHVTDGILLKDNRLVIPFIWRADILQKLHLSHCGIEKTKANARTTVFWPGMNKHIEDMVSCCEKCLKYQIPQNCHDVPELLEKRQAKYKEFYDRQGSKQLPQLKEGDSVRLKKPGDKHLPRAIVTGKHDTPRSYMITDETGREYRRNRRHIQLTQEPLVTILDNDLINDSQSVTKQSSVSSPSVTRESDANLEPDLPDTDATSVQRRSTRMIMCTPEENSAPDCLSGRITFGSKPELSIAVGWGQSTIVDVLPLSAYTSMVFEQFMNTGAETSGNERKLYGIHEK